MANRRWPVVATKDADKLTTLRGRTERPLERGARWAAIVEIAIKGIGVMYVAVAAGTWLVERQG